MVDPLDSYPLLKCRQGALFQRNPVCALCFRVCKELCHAYGAIHFDLLRSMQAADSLCTCLIEHAWEPPDVAQCHQWLENHLDNDAELMCACATLSTTIATMTDAPEPLQSLGQDLRCLVHGEANRIYTNLREAVRHEQITLSSAAYGSLPQMPTKKQTTKQPKCMNATQHNQYNGPFFQGCTFTTNNTTNNFFGHVPFSSKSECSEAPSHDSAEKDSRTRRLFLTPDGDEDYTRTEEERNRFLNYLSDHHLSRRQIDCSRDNPINKAVVCFYAKWKHLRYVRPQTGPAPVLRFLTDTCALQRAAEERAISAILGKMLKSDYDPDVFYDVCDYFN